MATTTTVTHTITGPGGEPLEGVQVIADIYPDGPGYVGVDDIAVITTHVAVSDANGLVSFDLVPNANIVPSGTAYRVRDYPRHGVKRTHYIEVPATGGPYWLGDILVDPPASLASAALSIHELETLAQGAHGGEVDAALAPATSFDPSSLDFETPQWRNLSAPYDGDDYHMASVGQPVLNDEGGVTYDGVNDFHEQISPITGLTATSPMSIYMVCRFDAVTDGAEVCGASGPGSVKLSFRQIDDAGTYYVGAFAGATELARVQVSLGEWFVLSYRINTTSGVGILAAVTLANSAAITGGKGFTRWYLGAGAVNYAACSFLAMRLIPSYLTDEQDAAVWADMAEYINRTTMVPRTLARVIFDGDSMTVGFPEPPMASYPSQVAVLRPLGLLWRNSGKNGAEVADLLAQAATDVDASVYGSEVGIEDCPTIVVVWVGINDINVRTVADIYTDITTYITGRQANGFTVIVGTLAKVNPVYGPAFEALVDDLNTLILANSAGADGIADIYAAPELDGSDPLYYADNVHLTAAGNLVVANIVSEALTGFVPNTGGLSRAELSIARGVTTVAESDGTGDYSGVSGQVAAIDHAHPGRTTLVLPESWFHMVNAYVGDSLTAVPGDDQFIDARLSDFTTPDNFGCYGPRSGYDSCRFGGIVNPASSSGTDGTMIHRLFYLTAGTYSLELVYTKDSFAGILKASMDGSDTGITADAYAAVEARNTSTIQAGIVVATTGYHHFFVYVSGKNGASGGYRLNMQGVIWNKTG